MRRILAGFAFAALGLITTGAASANQVKATESPATITITTGQGLSFGSIVAAPAGGTVTVAPDGTRTLGGLFGLGGGFSAASFTVEVSLGANPHYQITLPPSTVLLGSGGAQMIVDTFQSFPAGSGNANPPARRDTMTVGAVLHVGAAQPAGSYSGVLNVTVNLN